MREGIGVLERRQVCSITTGGVLKLRVVLHQSSPVGGDATLTSLGWPCVRQKGSVSISGILAQASAFQAG